MRVNQIKIGILLSYISIGINTIIQLVYTPIMLRLLGQSDYGLYTLVSSVVSYLSLFSLGFTGAYLRFYSAAELEGEKRTAQINGMFMTVFAFLGILAFVCGMVLSCYPKALFGYKLLPDELHTAQVLMRILVINIALTFPASVFDSMLVAHEQFAFQRSVNIIGTIVNPLVALPLLLAGYGSVSMVCVTTAVTLAKLLINIIICTRKFHFSFSFTNFDMRVLKEMTSFSMFIFINMLIDQINWNVDNYILGRIVGTVEVAVYGVAAQLRAMFSSFSSPISNVYAPRVNRIIASRDDSEKAMTELLERVGRIQYMLVLYIFVGFVFCGKIFIQRWAGTGYENSYYTALLLLFPLIICLPFNLGIEIRRAMNLHKKPALYMLVTSILNIIISIPLTYWKGAIGAALGTCICLLLNTVVISRYYNKVLHLDVMKLYVSMLEITKSVAIPILFGLAALLFDSALLNVLWAVIYTIMYGIFAYFFASNESEKEGVRSFIHRIIPNKNR